MLGRDGSVDWPCLPRFDSPACFALLGDETAGRWLLAPASGGPWVRHVPGSSRRTSEAEDLYRRLLAVRNDLGLLAEEYDTTARRQLGNVPQAFSHGALVNTARRLSGGDLTPG